MKNYQTVKMTALLLALLAAAPAVMACGSEGTTADTTAAVTSADTAAVTETETEAVTEPAYTDDMPDTDLGGYSFRFFSELWTYDNTYGAHRMMYEEYTGNPVNDVLHESTLYIEDRFNCDIVMIDGGDPYQMVDNAKNSMLSGENAFDLIVGHDGNMRNLAQQGFLTNILDIEQFNFDKPWWQPSKGLDFLGDLYFASSYLSFTGLHWTRALMVNKDYMHSIDLEMPYDLVREGKWTLDAMLAYVKNASNDVDGNGKLDSAVDKVAFATGGETLYCMQEALGITTYRRTEDSIVLDLDVERADTGLTKLREFHKSGEFLHDTSTQFAEQHFMTGNVLMVYGQIGDAYNYYRDCDFAYGFLPSPKYDEAQESYLNCCTDMPWGIPNTISEEQGDIIGTVIEAMSCRNYLYVLPAYFDVAMKSRTADTEIDAEMLQLIADTRILPYARSYDLRFGALYKDLFTSNKNVASYYEAQKKNAEKTLTKLIDTYEEMKNN